MVERIPAAVVPSPPMTGYKSGAPTRRAILLALLESEPRTVRGLADAVGITQPGAVYHVERMVELGWLRVDRRMGQRGSDVYLTDAGREVAKTV